MNTSRVLPVLIVHGMGWGQDDRDYAQPLQRGITREFERALVRLELPLGPEIPVLAFQAAYWAPILQRSQDALLSLMKLGGRSVWQRYSPIAIARRQMIGLLGDIVMYESGSWHPAYRAIHEEVERCVQALEDTVAPAESADRLPLTVIGHSLGSAIVSDYVWDSTRDAPEPYAFRAHPFRLKNMVLLGSPLPVYALRDRPNASPEALAKALDKPVEVDPDGGLWLNLYDPQDPIAFPLRPIHAYAEVGVVDCPVRAGSFFATRTPLAHTGYWKSRDVAAIIGLKLALDWVALTVPDFAGEPYTRAVQALKASLARTK